jgi:imidazolonepropionase-like amidohydrolase
VKRIIALLLLAAAPVAAENVAIVGGRVVTNSGAPVERGTVLISGGRVTGVTSGPAPVGYRVIDAGGKWVTPGVIPAISQIGLVEVNAVDEANDTEARKSPASAALDLSRAYNPADTAIAITRIEGVTAAVSAGLPGRSLFAGQGMIVSLADGATRPLKPRAFHYVALGEAGADTAGGSRPAAWNELLNALEEARRVQTGILPAMRDQHKDLRVTRDDAESLVPVLTGEVPLLVRVDRASDIRQVLTLKQRYPAIRLVLVSAREGWMVAKELAAANVGVITSGMDNLPAEFEAIAATMSNVGRLVAAGVTVALGTPNLDGSFQPRLLPQYAGNMVAQGRLPGGVGLSWDQAFASMTKAPADLFGLSDMGRLQPGARADLVIWDGDPLELSSAPVAVFIEGREQPMTSRQTALARRYFPKAPETGLPRAFTR